METNQNKTNEKKTKKNTNKKTSNKHYTKKKENAKKVNNSNTKTVKIDKKVIDENVNHPKHYTDNFSGIEVIKSNCDLTGCLFNVFKYCMRAGKKDVILQELGKAKFYCNYYINGVKEGTITPQHKITEESFWNITVTAHKATKDIDSYGKDGDIDDENLKKLLKGEIFAHFYLAISATQNISWWKFNKSCMVKLHLEHLECVLKYIDELIEIYNKEEVNNER